ncbi:hypothetical protein [Photobacterium nomapromontoriensis]|uniref:hypothetical protein n=1 Tax=Photobacterium nomapromontoriensis TaxID=2910237 RepID=UPI003D0D2A06
MSKISIAYVGDKPFKKDTITGSLLVFPRHEAVAVETAIAHMLLQYPKVWVREEQVASLLKDAESLAEIKAQEEADAKAKAEAEAKEISMEVELAGDTVDLAKLNSAKLATLIEAHDLNIDAKGAQESVEAFRLRVRDAIRG